MKPFVKWPGGKIQILDKLKDRMPRQYSCYYEPFIGGGALFLDIQSKSAVINDVNEQLLNVYRQLKSNTEAVIEAIHKFDIGAWDKECYLKHRDMYNLKIKEGKLDVECAALLIHINRHCFNALYRVNSKGLFNAAYNYKTHVISIDYDNIRNIGLYLKECNVDIRQGDFEQACVDVECGDFVYFDSPYIPVTDTANFTEYTKGGFSLENHKRLATFCKQLSKKGVYLMISNNDVPLVYELYSGFKIEAFDVKRSINRVASKRTGREVLITNY